MTYEQFAASFRTRGIQERSVFRRVWDCLPPRYVVHESTFRRTWEHTIDWARVGFELRIIVPNRAGYFAGPNATGRQFCWPWQWLRLYYNARVAR